MQKPHGSTRLRAAAAGAGVFLGGLALAMLWVRVSLDWSDARPHEGAITEIRYIVFALIGVGLAIAALICGILVARRIRRAGSRRSVDSSGAAD